LLCLPWSQYERRFKGWWKKYWQKPKQARHRRPRDPSSCAACCCEQHLANQERGQASPWKQVKSRWGRPKQHSSAGYAYSNPGCPYYKVTGEGIHALRRDGRRNAEETAQWECGYCGSKRTAASPYPCGCLIFPASHPKSDPSDSFGILATATDLLDSTSVWQLHAFFRLACMHTPISLDFSVISHFCMLHPYELDSNLPNAFHPSAMLILTPMLDKVNRL